MADVSNQSDCIIKNLRSEMKGVQEKEFIMGVRGRQKKPSNARMCSRGTDFSIYPSHQ